MSTLPSAAAPSSSSSRDGDGAVGEAPSGAIDAPNGFAETEMAEEENERDEDEVAGALAGESAAKSEEAASEMRSEARFWLFVNLREWAGQ